METRSNVVAIGVFVIGIFAMALMSLYWLATTGEATEETDLIVVFEGAVTGLSKGAAVYFNGIKIGSVKRIEFSKNDPTRVLAYATIDATAPLKKDTTAELGFTGLTGVAYIEMKGGTISSENLLGETGTPSIVANPSFFQDILDTARGVMSKADVTLSEITTLLKDNRGPLTNTFANVESFSKALADNSDNISTFLADISVAGKSFASLSTRLEHLVGQIDPVVAAVDPETIAAILKDAAVLTKQLAEASGKIETIIASADSATKEVQTFAAGLNTSLKSVDGILAAVDQQKVANTIDGLEAIAGTFKDRKADVSALIGDARDVAKNVNVITERLAARADDIEGTIVDARSAVQNAGKLAESLSTSADKAEKIVSAIKPEAVGAAVDNINTLTGRLAARSDDIDKIITDTGATLEETRDVAKNAKIITEKIAGRAEDIDGVIVDTRTAVQNAGKLTESLAASVDKAGKIVDAIKPEAVGAAIDNVNTLSGRLAARSDDIDKIITDTGATLEETRDVAKNAKIITEKIAGRAEDIDGVIADTRTAVQNAGKLTESLAASVDKAGKIVDAIKPEAVGAAIDNVNTLSGRLAARSDDVDKIITDTGAMLEESRVAAANVKDITGSLKARTGSVDAIITNVETVTGKLPALTTDISAALEQVRVLASAIEADKINRAVGNVETLTGRLAARSDDFDAIITDARKSSENVESITRSLAAKNEDVQAIVDQALDLSKRLNATTVRIDGLVAKADAMLGDENTGGLISEARRASTAIANIAEAFESRAASISSGVDRLTSSGVSKLEELLDLGQKALRQIERSVQSLEQNPQRILFGGPEVRQVGGNRR